MKNKKLSASGGKSKKSIKKSLRKKTRLKKKLLLKKQPRSKKLLDKKEVLLPRIESMTRDEKIETLLRRGRTRGFVTYSEILRYFPTIEEEISVLENLYARFEEENIEVLETKAFLNVDEPKAVVAKPKAAKKS